MRISSSLRGRATRENKNTPDESDVFSWRGGRDSNPRPGYPGTHLAGEPIQPLWHLPVFELKISSWAIAQPVLINLQIFQHSNMQPRSGGSGIRTHVGVTQTCFQDMRLQPLGHPSSILMIIRRRTSFYHNKLESLPVLKRDFSG
jgi:hypothetical protein